MKDRDILDSWKEIAAYLGRSEKTCRRLEKELGLPVHRLEDSPKARVFAYREEIDQWMEEILNGKLPNDIENSFSVSQTSSSTQAISQEAISKEFHTQEIVTSDLRAFVSLIRKPKIALPVLLIVILVGLTTIYFLHRNARIAWARNELLPEIIRLVEEDDYMAAFKLAQQAEKYIPKDPILIEQWPTISNQVSIITTPPQAKVYRRDYTATHSDWEYLGQTPIEGIRIPKGYSRLKIAKDRYLTVERGVFDWMSPIHHKLDYVGSIPPGMIRVPGGNYEMVLPVIGLSEAVQLGDFLIDKYEVTNRQYKEFIDSGGYKNKSYWKHEFLKDGQALSWEEAMAELKDATGRPGPATWELGTYPQGQDNYPVTGISWHEASAYAEFAGKSLPTVYHWTKAAGTKYCTAFIVPLSNIGGSGIAPVGKYQGMSPYGTYDMAGNVKEWCWNKSGGLRFIMGGAWNGPSYQFNLANAYSPFDRSASNGFRCIKDLSLAETSEKVSQSIIFSSPRDYSQEKIVSDEIFNIYKSVYSYDRTELSPIIEFSDDTSPHWTKEKITYNAAYGNERIIAYLFLPRNSKPPYQTVVYFPGGEALYLRSSEKLAFIGEYKRKFDFYTDFIVKSGRALLYPVYKSTYERSDGFTIETATYSSFKEHYICWVKDFQRSLDYLETRADIDHDKLAFYGLSMGASLGSHLLALENRIKAGVFEAGGLEPGERNSQRKVGQIDYVTRIRLPILMLNGRYDPYYTEEWSVRPMYRLLGTPEKDKKLVLFDTGHDIPNRNKVMKEILDWLDRYLGPVN